MDAGTLATREYRASIYPRIYYDLEQLESWEQSQTTQPQEWSPSVVRGQNPQQNKTPQRQQKRYPVKRERRPLCMGDLFEGTARQ